MNLSDVGYLTEDPAKEYSRGLDRCDTLDKLKAFLHSWEGLADDAIKLVDSWGTREFNKWRKSLKKERAGQFSEDEKAAVVLMPELMIKASVLSEQYCCPWGLAVKRLTEVPATTKKSSGARLESFEAFEGEK